MTYDQIEILVFQIVLPAVALGDLTLVQRMPYRLVGHLGNTRDTGDIIQFVYHTGVNGEGAASQFLSKAQCQERTQVAGMMQTRMLGVFDHLLIQFIHTTGDGLYQSTTTYYHVEIHLKALCLDFFYDRLTAVVKLIHDKGVAAEFFKRMVDGGMHQQILILEDSYFRRNHSRVNSKYFHKVLCY